MANPIFRAGHIVWHDLFTQDMAASEQFYTNVLGWKIGELQGTDTPSPYAIIFAGTQPIGRLAKAPHESMEPFWTPYISVDDVDAAGERAKAAGGKLLVGPRDIPGVGRWAYLLDPQGAGLHAWKGSYGDGPVRDRPVPGEFVWEELTTTDLGAASQFYAAVVGWKESGQTFFAGEVPVASAKRGEAPAWVSYVLVDNLDKALVRATENGAKVIVGWMPVPESGCAAVIEDNAGACLGLFEELR